MELNIPNMEQMAAEYNSALRAQSAAASDNGENLIEQIMLLSETQLDIMTETSCCAQSNSRTARTYSYLKNLTYQSIIALNSLLGKGEYIPSFRTPARMNQNTAVMRLINTQIDIFTLLDRLGQYRNDLVNVLILENRKMALFASLV